MGWTAAAGVDPWSQCAYSGLVIPLCNHAGRHPDDRPISVDAVATALLPIAYPQADRRSSWRWVKRCRAMQLWWLGASMSSNSSNCAPRQVNGAAVDQDETTFKRTARPASSSAVPTLRKCDVPAKRLGTAILTQSLCAATPEIWGLLTQGAARHSVRRAVRAIVFVHGAAWISPFQPGYA